MDQYQLLIKLIQNTFNNRSHEGLFQFCPIKVFYDSHTACIVARKNSEAFKQHQTKSKSIYANLKEHQKFKVGDFVLLRLKPKAFRKESSSFYPRYTSQRYVIENIHYDAHPLLYSLTNFPKKRRFYGWELQKVPEQFLQSSDPNYIVVKDVLLESVPVLRSGRSLANRQEVVYIIDKSDIKCRPDF